MRKGKTGHVERLLRGVAEIRITGAAPWKLINACVRERITVEHTTQVITNHDSPVMAVRTMKDSSIVRGMMAVREGEADAFGQRRGAGSEQTGLVEHDVSCHADKFRGADQSFQTRRIKTLR